MRKTAKKDMYQDVTNIIIEALEKNLKPWAQPWEGGGGLAFPLRHTGENYKGINILHLWAIAQKRGYKAPHWMTYKQAKDLGGQVRKGEKSTVVFYAGKLSIEDEEATLEGEEKFIHYMKSYYVFNIEQIDDLPEKYSFTPAPAFNHELERIVHIDNFILNTKATFKEEDSTEAYYEILSDEIILPSLNKFKNSTVFYSTALHELIHWTGHKSRLDRLKDRKKTESIAFEELIAELGAAFLSVEMGINPDLENHHASYIKGWIKHLKEDKKAIFRAAAAAQRAADFLHDLQPKPKFEEVDFDGVIQQGDKFGQFNGTKEQFEQLATR